MYLYFEMVPKYPDNRIQSRYTIVRMLHNWVYPKNPKSASLSQKKCFGNKHTQYTMVVKKQKLMFLTCTTQLVWSVDKVLKQ